MSANTQTNINKNIRVTIRFDEELIERVKKYASDNGMSDLGLSTVIRLILKKFLQEKGYIFTANEQANEEANKEANL